jgi:hypothetical protein
LRWSVCVAPAGGNVDSNREVHGKMWKCWLTCKCLKVFANYRGVIRKGQSTASISSSPAFKPMTNNPPRAQSYIGGGGCSFWHVCIAVPPRSCKPSRRAAYPAALLCEVRGLLGMV